MVPKKIINNRDVKVTAFPTSVLEEIPNTRFGIATTFFNIQTAKYIHPFYDPMTSISSNSLELTGITESRGWRTMGSFICCTTHYTLLYYQ